MIDPDRGTGRTTKQMLDAPQGAVFISSHVGTLPYDRALAEKCERRDLTVVAPVWLTNGGWHGQLFTGIVIDHDARLTAAEREHLRSALTLVRSLQPLTKNEMRHLELAAERAWRS